MFCSLTEAPLPDHTPTPPNTPKRTRNGPETDPKRTRNGAEIQEWQGVPARWGDPARCVPTPKPPTVRENHEPFFGLYGVKNPEGPKIEKIRDFKRD